MRPFPRSPRPRPTIPRPRSRNTREMSAVDNMTNAELPTSYRTQLRSCLVILMRAMANAASRASPRCAVPQTSPDAGQTQTRRKAVCACPRTCLHESGPPSRAVKSPCRPHGRPRTASQQAILLVCGPSLTTTGRVLTSCCSLYMICRSVTSNIRVRNGYDHARTHHARHVRPRRLRPPAFVHRRHPRRGGRVSFGQPGSRSAVLLRC